MLILFPSELFNNKKVDPAFLEEYQAAEEAGHDVGLLDQFRLDQGQYREAIRFQENGVRAIYRGWMLHPTQYKGLARALEDVGIDLINNPRQYMNCHWFPEFYRYIKDQTPVSTWFVQYSDGSVDVNKLFEWAQNFGETPLIVKDFVKSRKHEWEEACYIPSALDEEGFKRVVNTFIKRQGSDLAGGVVIRKFVPLKQVGTHPKSGMPLFNEYRMFILNGRLVASDNYWAEGRGNEKPNLVGLVDVVKTVDSNFFTIDMAQTEDGDWIIVELGDGQVSGLQEIDPHLFYQVLKDNGFEK